MAKTSPQAPIATAVSYRTKRIDSYSWQAYKITQLSDGTFREESIFKPDILDLLIVKISKLMRAEGQTEFLERKKTANA